MTPKTRETLILLVTEANCRREAARLDLRDAVNDDDSQRIFLATTRYIIEARVCWTLREAILLIDGEDELATITDEAGQRCVGDEIDKYRLRDPAAMTRRVMALIDDGALRVGFEPSGLMG